MPVVISEVILRSEQGATNPFLCRAANGERYFVKGRGIGKEQLRSEWIAGCLARGMALPIANFDQMEVPAAIVSFSAMPDIAQLGAGIAFGSELVPNAQEITFLQSKKVDARLQAEVLLFDWWILNGDRILSERGGNPNILCTGWDEPQISIIDHNAAFEDALTPQSLWESHIFRMGKSLWTPAFIREITPRLQMNAALLSQFWDQMPESWFSDDDPTSEISDLEFARIDQILNRPFSAPDSFWGGVL